MLANFYFLGNNCMLLCAWKFLFPLGIFALHVQYLKITHRDHGFDFIEYQNKHSKGLILVYFLSIYFIEENSKLFCDSSNKLENYKF